VLTYLYYKIELGCRRPILYLLILWHFTLNTYLYKVQMGERTMKSIAETT
jgi:hypothetical protein